MFLEPPSRRGCWLSWPAMMFSLVMVASAAAQDRPNLLVIMADDIGYENFGCYGSTVYETPNIDRLASQGIRFDHGHSQPICTPSRVQIMTGIHNQRNYVRFGLLDPAAVTFAQVLRQAGYATAIAGKWQLDGGIDAPRHFGFDRHCLWQLVRRPSRYPNPGLEIDGELKDFKNGEFGPDLVSDYLCEFFESRRDSDQPFLAYYPMILPHWPFVPTPDHPDWDPAMWRDATNEPGGYRDQKYWDGFVRYTDKMVGKLLDRLTATGLIDNTLVIFTADNGTFVDIVSPFRGRDYRGGKGKTLDSGTHVPMIASWPAKIRPGQVSDQLVDFTDIFPTLLDVAGVTPPTELAEQLDGTSLLPVFAGRAEERVKPVIYCWYERDGRRGMASQHVRDQRYKLYHDGGFFDTQADPDETRDLRGTQLAPEQSETLARLEQELAVRVEQTRRYDPIQRAKRQATN